MPTETVRRLSKNIATHCHSKLGNLLSFRGAKPAWDGRSDEESLFSLVS